MSFGLNRAEIIGRLGADVTVNHLVSGAVWPTSASLPASPKEGLKNSTAPCLKRFGLREINGLP